MMEDHQGGNSVACALAAAVLEDCVRRLALSSTLQANGALTTAAPAETEGATAVFATIARHAELERAYADLLAARQRPNRTAKQRAELNAAIAGAQRALRANLSSMCRGLKEAPSAASEQARLAEERVSLMELLQRTAEDVRAGRGCSSFVEHVEREAAGQARLHETLRKEEALAAEVEQLAASMSTEETQHARDVALKQAELRTLKETHRTTTLQSSASVRYTRRESTAHTDTLHTGAALRESEQQNQLVELETAIAEETAASEITLAELKKEQETLARVSQQWKQRQGADVEAKTEELAEVRARRQAQVDELTQLRGRYQNDLTQLAERKLSVAEQLRADHDTRAQLEAQEVAASQLQKVIGSMFTELLVAAADAAEPKAAKPSGKKK